MDKLGCGMAMAKLHELSRKSIEGYIVLELTLIRKATWQSNADIERVGKLV